MHPPLPLLDHSIDRRWNTAQFCRRREAKDRNYGKARSYLYIFTMRKLIYAKPLREILHHVNNIQRLDEFINLANGK